jgi:multicomponent Na+:H+ antiporter subunit G
LTVAVFILLTNPISAHALARASYKSAVRLYDGTVVDKCREFGERKEAPNAAGTSESSEGGEE